MPIEFSLCIICVNHFSCQEIYLCSFSHALTHNHDAHEVLLVENLQCSTEGITDVVIKALVELSDLNGPAMSGQIVT